MTTEAYTLWLRLYDARMADWKTNEEQLAKVAAIIEADREEVAEQERAAIVAEERAAFNAGIEAAAKALEADAKLCDCAALEERECACGAWNDYKTITSARAVEIVRGLKGEIK